jgi:hypothetical protein
VISLPFLIFAGLAWTQPPAMPPVSLAPDPQAGATAYHQHARAAVDEVLAAREFGGYGGPSLMSRMLRWLGRLLRSIGQILGELPRWLFWLLFAWLVLALLAILAHLLYVVVGLFGARGARAGSQGAAELGRGELYGIVDLNFDTAYRRARELLAAGHWAAATRHFYVAAILGLDRAGLIRFRQSKTNHDYVGELRPHPPEHDLFGRLTSQFELAVYGGRPPDAALCRNVAELVDALPHDELPAR